MARRKHHRGYRGANANSPDLPPKIELPIKPGPYTETELNTCIHKKGSTGIRKGS